MKSRRITIVAFLLCATLVMGIGYAVLADQLSITGNAIYRPNSVVNDRVDGAIKFTAANADGDHCTSATVTGDDTADMTVVINDIADGTNTFEAVATYTVTYETTDLSLSKVVVSAAPTITAGPSSSEAVPGFSIDAVVTYDDAADAAAGVLSPGNTLTVTVTVTYDATAVTPAPTSAVNAYVGVVLSVQPQGV